MAGGGHRSTLKQKNKSHNTGKHRSKRDLKREAHGKVNLKSLTKKKKLKEALRLDALNKRLSGRHEGFDERRVGTISLPPRLVVIVSLEKNVKPAAVLELLREADLSAISNVSQQEITHVSACKMKSRMCFMMPEYGNLQAVMDATRVADVVLFLMSSENGVDKFGDHCLSCVIGQGISSHMFICQGLCDLQKKKLSDARKIMEKIVDTRFPGEKVKSLDIWQEAQTLWRQVSSISVKEVNFRDSRPYLLAEKFEYAANVEDGMGDDGEGAGYGTLKLSGYLRGQSLNVNQLIHIPGLGDFQMSQIDSSDDPYPLVIKGNKDRRGDKKESDEMKDASSRTFCLAKASNPESLQSEVIPDEMDQEQTWPTEEEMGEAKKRIKALKGTSDYQSSWIEALEEGDADDDSDDDDESDEEGMDGGTGQGGDNSDDDDMEQDNNNFDTMTETDAGDDANYDDQIDMDEEKRMYEKMKEEKLHVQFPDEIDTPVDIPARTRFARYRGMDSFRTSEWDPNDSLPFDYARIYRVTKHHYKRLKKISKKQKEEDDEIDNMDPEVGEFITIHVKNVPKSIMEIYKSNSVISAYGLFSNEQKMTLISCLVMRMNGFTSPVKSKDPLVFQIGFRRFSANPIFSEHSFQNGKFKMERFLPANGFIVASMYAPITFAPAPVLAFRENVMGKYDLVAKGSLLPLDTNRIVIKRVVLSAATFKINKRSVVVRYMFFNREDIEFYKPIELRTKYGKRGHIKQALGTHGHMKCSFSGQFKSEDTVMMNLYKRVFPKWSYNPVVSILPPVIGELMEKDEEEMVEQERGDAYKLFD